LCKKVNDIYTYNIESNVWRKEIVSGTPPTPRCDIVATKYGKKIVVMGGSDENMNFLIDVHIFDIENKTWYQPAMSGSIPTSRIACCSARIDNIMYIYGGGLWDNKSQSYVTDFPEMCFLNLDTFSWSIPTAYGDIPKHLTKFSNMITVGHHLILEGGYDFVNAPCYFFDTVTCTWEKANINLVSNACTNSCASFNRVGNFGYLFGGSRGIGSNMMCKIDLSHLKEFF